MTTNKNKLKTQSISLRIEENLKKEFFELLDSQDKTFSKWLRTAMIVYIEKNDEKVEHENERKKYGLS